MESIKKIFKIGYGPSSSHTMAPRKASELFKEEYPNAASFKATLYGSLAATGIGHLTDKAIIAAFSPTPCQIVFHPEIVLDYHTNGLKLEALDHSGSIIGDRLVFSVGGGEITDGKSEEEANPIYELHSMKEILNWCKNYGKTFWEYVEEHEESDIWDYLENIWKVMRNSIERGIDAEGTLPGGLHIPRKASSYYVKAKSYSRSLKRRSLAFAYALAVAEENASGGKIVTAPTCGSSGVLPAVLYLLEKDFEFSRPKIMRALATAGIIGNLIKKNASISGSKVGCQGEIGSACSMTAAAAAQIFGATPSQIEYAAEMGLEHHLGLTCDPIMGLVQIPCIERNAFAAARALDSCTYAILSDGRHIVTFDRVVETMNRTGHDIPSIYKETSEGGLALEL